MLFRSLDREPLEGISYYRLRQTDYDGYSTLSQVVAISRNVSGILQVSCAVNNSSGMLEIYLDAGFSEVVQFSLTDASGRLLSVDQMPVERGFNHIQIPVNQLAEGVYFLEVSSDSGFSVHKILH